MYNAYGNSDQDSHHGSTRLHLDVTSAVNIMLYAAPYPDGSPGLALWHIFPLSDTNEIREFLQEAQSVGFNGQGDPIHSHDIYLTPLLLAMLEQRTGIWPYAIYQAPGDAVFIPAGCAHQVRD
jgi:lysine-specific demethylase 3